jgi:hypothetical protein
MPAASVFEAFVHDGERNAGGETTRSRLLAFAQQAHALEAGRHNAQRGGWKRAYRE